MQITFLHRHDLTTNESKCITTVDDNQCLIADVDILCHFVAPKPYHFYLVEEVLRFDLMGHMWKLIKNWFQESSNRSPNLSQNSSPKCPWTWTFPQTLSQTLPWILPQILPQTLSWIFPWTFPQTILLTITQTNRNVHAIIWLVSSPLLHSQMLNFHQSLLC